VNHEEVKCAICLAKVEREDLVDHEFWHATLSNQSMAIQKERRSRDVHIHIDTKPRT